MRIPSFISKCLLSCLIPAIVSQPLYGFYDEAHLRSQTYQDPFHENSSISYERVLQILKDVESGALESRCNEETLERINDWLVSLARAGVIPGDTEGESLLEIDIDDLNDDEANFEFGSYFDLDVKFTLIPTFESHRIEAFICGGWLSKKWKKTKKFVVAHKKEILIGAAVIVGAAIVVAAVTYGVGAAAASAATSAAAGAAASGNDHNHSAIKNSDVTNQAETIKEMVLSKELVSLDNLHFPQEENARILGQACTQAAFEKLQNSVSCNIYFSSDLEKMGGLKPETHHLIDQAFSKPIPWYSWDYANSFKENVYAARGAYAADLKLYDQAYSDFDKALKLNPNNSDVYLNRSFANLETGNIKEAISDFEKYKETSPPTAGDIFRFSKGFIKNVPLGSKESCEGSCEFFYNAACHPIATSKQMISSIGYLKDAVKTGEWAEISQVLAPELVDLVTLWDYLTFEERGEKSGFVFGKYTTDYLIGGGLLKAGKITANQIKILAKLHKGLVRTEQVFAIETTLSAGIANKGISVMEELVVNSTAGLSEEAMLSSIQKFQKAKDYLSPYKGVYMPESQLRTLIKESGLDAIPRPKGIPENFRVKIADKCSGIVYMHPAHEHTSVRVMFGMPHSPNQMQQKAYVVMKKNGKTIDKMGNPVDSKSLEAHISLEEFLYSPE